MAIDEAKYRELLERLDPKLKLKRLEEELDGNEAKGVTGLRENLLMALRSWESQKRLVEMRLAARERIPEAQLKAYDTGQQEAGVNLEMLALQAELYAEEIEKTERQVAEIRQAGLSDNKSKTNGVVPQPIKPV